MIWFSHGPELSRWISVKTPHTNDSRVSNKKPEIQKDFHVVKKIMEFATLWLIRASIKLKKALLRTKCEFNTVHLDVFIIILYFHYRTVKTLVHTLVKMKGGTITNHLTQIPDVNESDLYPYLLKVLKVILFFFLFFTLNRRKGGYNDNYIITIYLFLSYTKVSAIFIATIHLDYGSILVMFVECFCIIVTIIIFGKIHILKSFEWIFTS